MVNARGKIDTKIWDYLYLLIFGVCLFELFLHTSYIIQKDKWIGDIIVGSHRMWDIIIYSLVLSISIVRLSVQKELNRTQQILAWSVLFFFGLHYFATGMHLDVLAFGCLCVGACNIPFQKILSLYLVESVILYVGVIAASLFQLIENRIYGSERMSLGFSHPNTLGTHTMTVIMAYFVWRKARVTWGEIAVAAIVEMMIFRVCVSRASFIGTIAFLFLCVCYKCYIRVRDMKVIEKLYEALTTLMCFSVFIFGGITVLLSYFYSDDKMWMVKANQWFSGRLSLGRVGFDKYNASLLGQLIKMNAEPKAGETYFYLDSFYVRAIFNWGVLLLLTFLALYFVASYRAKIAKEFLCLSALTVLALHGMMEMSMASVVYNPYLLLVLATIGKETEKRIML